MTVFQRLLMFLGLFTLIILIFALAILLIGLGLWAYEEISESIEHWRRFK